MRQLLQIIIFIYISFPVLGQSEIGYIDYSKVIKVLPEYNSGQNAIQLKEKRYIDSLKALFKSMENYYNSLPHNIQPDSSVAIEIEDSLVSLQTGFQEFQDFADKDIQKDQNDLDKEMKRLIKSKLKEFCVQNNIVCIHEKESILHCSQCKDYTKMFIHFIKK